MSIEQALISQARPFMVAAKARDLIRGEISKGCREEISHLPIALEPKFTPIWVFGESSNTQHYWVKEHPVSNNDWVYIVIVCTWHFDEENNAPDLTLAIDNKGNLWRNDGHVCGGIRFKCKNKKEPISAEDFFSRFHWWMSGKNMKWKKVNRITQKNSGNSDSPRFPDEIGFERMKPEVIFKESLFASLWVFSVIFIIKF